MTNTIHHKHMLTDTGIRLFNRIKNRRVSISKLTNAELIDSAYLHDCGLIKFDRTKKGNPSKFLIINS